MYLTLPTQFDTFNGSLVLVNNTYFNNTAQVRVDVHDHVAYNHNSDWSSNWMDSSRLVHTYMRIAHGVGFSPKLCVYV